MMIAEQAIPTALAQSATVEHYESERQRVDVFSLAALQHSFRFLRPLKPSLALEVQNIINEEPIPKPFELQEQQCEHYYVRLAPELVRDIIVILSRHLQLLEHKRYYLDPILAGNLVVLSAITRDWVNLGAAMVQRLQEDAAFQ